MQVWPIPSSTSYHHTYVSTTIRFLVTWFQGESAVHTRVKWAGCTALQLLLQLQRCSTSVSKGCAWSKIEEERTITMTNGCCVQSDHTTVPQLPLEDKPKRRLILQLEHNRLIKAPQAHIQQVRSQRARPIEGTFARLVLSTIFISYSTVR
jgi:hypothetical protein